MSITIDGFEIDAALAEDHAFDNDVTEHPVEQGADVTDHVRARPITVTIQGVVSDTPIGPLAERRRAALAGDTGDGAQFTILPSSEAFNRLQSIRTKREPVTIETSLRTFDNMVLASLTSSPQAQDAFYFTATFVQVQIVENIRTSARVAVPRAKRKVNLGAKPAPDATAAQVPTQVGSRYRLSHSAQSFPGAF